MKNIVLFGAPGAGKGTQAVKLVEKYGFNHISTGQVIRNEIAAQTPAGKQVEECIARGEFAPDDLVIAIVKNFMATHQDVEGSIFDGFPRNFSAKTSSGTSPSGITLPSSGDSINILLISCSFLFHKFNLSWELL